MKLINKVYQITIPIILIIIVSFSYIKYLELEDRVNDEKKKQISSNIEKSLNLKNNPLFLSYFDYIEYNLHKEADLNKESLYKLFETQFEINSLYGKHLIQISLVDKDFNKIVAFGANEYENKIEKPNFTLQCDEQKCKSLFSIFTEKRQIVVLSISGENGDFIDKNLIKGHLIVAYKVDNTTIDRLKYEFLSQAILYNFILLVFLLLLVLVIVKMIVNPIKVLSSNILNKLENRNEKLDTNIHEITSLEKTFSTYSNSIENQKNEILKLNKDLEKKVHERTIELENAYKNITQYKYLFEQNKAIMFLIDPKNGLIVDANQAAVDFYGYSYKDLVSKNIYEINILSKDEIEKEKENAKKEKRSCFYYEHKLKDGTIRSVEVISGPITIEDKNLLYSIIHDITEYKKQEKIIKEQSKLASMGEMIGNIAHQWRQPLSVISVSASGLKVMTEFEQEIDSKKIISITDSIVSQTSYLSKVIDNFQNFIKGDTSYTKLNMDYLIDNTLTLTDAVIKNNDIKLIKNIEPDLYINGCLNMLCEALINIINNSKDAFLNSEDKIIFIEIKKENKDVVIIFKDTAGGIKEDILAKIFEPYFTSKHKSIGTGLGLYIAEKIVREQHSGSIFAKNVEFEFNSKFYKGVEIKILIPLYK